MLRSLLLACGCSLALGLVSARAETPASWTKTHLPELVEVYRGFHRAPELSSQEEKTAAKLADYLKKLGCEIQAGVGGHGVVALLKNGPGPTLMVRTDLDALPVTENTDLVYSSQVKVEKADGTTTGVMHACGHDIHMTNLIGVAQYLASHKQDWSGTVMFIGQPAEETGRGASGDARERAVREISQARHGAGIACRCSAASGQDRLSPRLHAGERRQRRHHDARSRRTRRLAAHARSTRSCRRRN